MKLVMNKVMQIKVLLADDHSVVRQGIRRVLESTDDIVVVGEAEDGEKALEMTQELQPDVIVCDLRLPVVSGIDVVHRVKERSIHTRVIILSAFDDDEHVFDAMAAGASGYLLKTMDSNKIPEAVRRANSGESVLYPPIAEKLAYLLSGNLAKKSELLTPRELEILALAAHGSRNKQIAGELNLSVRTVEGHFARILGKLSASSRVEAINTAMAKGLVKVAKEGP